MVGGGVSCLRAVTKSVIFRLGLERSTMTQAGGDSFARDSRASAVLAARMGKPRSRPVPVTRLVKIKSSDRSKPIIEQVLVVLVGWVETGLSGPGEAHHWERWASTGPESPVSTHPTGLGLNTLARRSRGPRRVGR